MREFLEKYLEKNQIGAVEFAEIAGVSKTTIYDILKGSKNTDKVYVDIAIKIAKAIGVEVEELCGRKFPEPTPERETTMLKKDELELLDAWRNATDAARESVLMVLKANPISVSKKSAG